MKVLIINTVPFEKNGISSMIMNYYESMKNNNIEFTIIANKTIDTEYYNKVSMPDNIIILPHRRSVKGSLKYFVYLNKFLKNNKFDIVHIHGNSSLMALEQYSIKRNKNGAKIIVHGHNIQGDFPLLDRLVKNYFLRNYDLALTAGHEAGEFLYGKNNFKVLPNAINTRRFLYSKKQRDLIRDKMNINTDTFLLINVSVHTIQKNKRFLIDVFKEFSKLNDNSMLLLIGSDTVVGNKNHKKEDINNYIKELDLEGKVRLLDSVGNIESYYSASDVFVFPSLFESFGMVAVEAQINGLNTLVSDNVPKEVGISSIINFSPLNKQIWVNELSLIKKKYSRSSQKTINYEKFNIDSCSEKLLNLYNDLIS